MNIFCKAALLNNLNIRRPVDGSVIQLAIPDSKATEIFRK